MGGEQTFHGAGECGVLFRQLLHELPPSRLSQVKGIPEGRFRSAVDRVRGV